jgi:toxin YoeB
LNAPAKSCPHPLRSVARAGQLRPRTTYAAPFVSDGIGKPQPLKNALAGYWSRRSNVEHRLVYRMKDGIIQIAPARYHY